MYAPDLEAAIAALHPGRALLREGTVRAFAAPAYEIPAIFYGLDRLRGRELDAFDHWYDHLFLWDEAEERLVGGLRLGEVARLVDPEGLHALECARLFGNGILSGRASALEIGCGWADPGMLPTLQRSLAAWLRGHDQCSQGLVLARTLIDRALAIGGSLVGTKDGAVLMEIGLSRFRLDPSIWTEAAAAQH